MWLVVCLMFALPSVALTRISIFADEISNNSISLKQLAVSIKLGEPTGEMQLKLAEFVNNGKRLTGTELTCNRLLVTSAGVACKDGKLVESGELIPLAFDVVDGDTFNVTLQPKSERWQISSRRLGSQWQGLIDIQAGAVKRFAPLLPTQAAKPSKGTVTGRIDLITQPGEAAKITGRLSLKDVDFSDAEGLHAGEKIAAVMALDAQRNGSRWRFNTSVDWPSGEMLWQPVYLAAGHKQIRLNGTWDPAFIQIDSADMEVAPIGKISFSGRWKQVTSTISDLDLNGRGLDLEPFYATFVKPFASGTAFDSLNTSGKADVKLKMSHGEVQSLALQLHDANVVDANKRFKIEHLRANLPWVNGAAGEGVISFDSASVGDLPIGAVNAKLQFAADSVGLGVLNLPLLDGAIKIENLQARRVGDRWTSEFNGAVEPVSLPKLTAALHWPRMEGSLEGIIPKVRFDGENVVIDGALQFKVFDGVVVATNMRLGGALGSAPQLEGTVVMSNLDLDVLTKTFAFGKIKGRIDVALENMLLSNWKPVRFDGRVMSSDGNYPRKISQQAVQNISSLGGAGAAAAIQRSFLRIFEQFGYKKIGLTCKLRDTICEMGGVVNTTQGYVLVQGGGIPSITVMGYNRQVGWEELLARIKAATQSNVGPVVK